MSANRILAKLSQLHPEFLLAIVLAISVLISGCLIDPNFTTPESPKSNSDPTTITEEVPSNPPETAENGSYSAHEVRLVEQKILNQTNTRRANHGLKPLERNTSLGIVSDYYAWKMWKDDFYAHRSPEGYFHPARLNMYGIRCIDSSAENLNHGEIYDQDSPIDLGKNLVSEWMNSSSHREAILTPEFSYIGVGVFVNDSEVWAVQLFCERIELEEGSIADRRAGQEQNTFSQHAVPRSQMLYKMKPLAR